MKRMMKRLAALLLALCLLAAVPLNASADIAEPQDVPWPVEAGGVQGSNTVWYAKAVYDLYYTGICWKIMDGENIVPGKAMTREELVVLLYELAWYASKLDRSPENPAYYQDSDGGRRYTDALDWAARNGILFGDGQGLAAGRPMTRQEMAVILLRFADYMGLELAESDGAFEIADEEEIAPWALEAMRQAHGKGLLQGVGQVIRCFEQESGGQIIASEYLADVLAPQKTVTRAEGYQAVWNYTQAAGIYLMWRNEFVDWHRWTPS